MKFQSTNTVPPGVFTPLLAKPNPNWFQWPYCRQPFPCRVMEGLSVAEGNAWAGRIGRVFALLRDAGLFSD